MGILVALPLQGGRMGGDVKRSVGCALCQRSSGVSRAGRGRCKKIADIARVFQLFEENGYDATGAKRMPSRMRQPVAKRLNLVS